MRSLVERSPGKKGYSQEVREGGIAPGQWEKQGIKCHPALNWHIQGCWRSRARLIPVMKLRASKQWSSGIQTFCCRCQGTNCTFQFESLRKYKDHIKKVLLYLFKRYEGDVTTNGHLLLNTDSILILNHEALLVRERKESKLVWWMGPKLPNKDGECQKHQRSGQARRQWEMWWGKVSRTVRNISSDENTQVSTWSNLWNVLSWWCYLVE